MDFSSLDLLASTALRDNNPTCADNSSTPADPHHPQHNHHDSVENDEDDDEADGNRDSVKEVETVGKGDSELGEMGSVKCGKHKKNSSKPMSIFVRDGKCVAKRLSTDAVRDKEKGREVTGDSKVAGIHQVNVTEQEGGSGLQNTAVHGAVGTPCPAQTTEAGLKPVSSTRPSCNGMGSSGHQHTLSVTSLDDCDGSLKIMTAFELIKSVVGELSCDSKTGSCTKSPQKPGHESDTSCEKVAERDCDAAQMSVAKSSSDSTLTSSGTAQAGGESDDITGEQQEKQREGIGSCCKKTSDSCTCDSGSPPLTTDHSQSDSTTPSSDVLTCPHQEKGTDTDNTPSDSVDLTVYGGSDSEKPPCLVSKVTEMSVESRTPSVCDEDFAVVSSCSGIEDRAVVNCPSALSADPDTGSLGNQEPQSSNTIQCDVNSILSPPPPHPLPAVTPSHALQDHTYSLVSKGRLLDNTDDSGDAFESADENVSADETERRPRSLSVDSVYLQYNLASLPNQQEVLSQNDKLALLSPTLSVDSISNDSSLSEHSTAAGGQSYSILVGSPNVKGTSVRHNLTFIDSQSMAGDKSAAGSDGACRITPSMLEAGGKSSLLDTNSLITVGPKCGKFRIGTFGSFSNSHIELEKENKKKLKNGLSSDPVMKTTLSAAAVPSPGSPFPLLQSPSEWDRSDAGSEAPDDLDSSTTEEKFLSSSHDSEAFGFTVGQVWRHPVFHDHDYCSKEISEEYLGKPVTPSTPLKTGKRKYVRKKVRQDSEEEKLRKGKYLKRELLKKDNRFNLGVSRGMDNRAAAPRSSLLAESLATKPNPVGRPRKRTEKQLEEYDAETGTKMKITGKYQDQYVYYLNKSSRNRRRKVDEKMPPGDKIILPAPKPGDIVVPHLSDADCEAIRHGGRMALMNNIPHPTGSLHLPHTDNGDMDSSIVNTILSMETEHGNLHSPLDSYEGVGHGEDFSDIEGNLTSEQVKMLFDCLEDYPMEETTTSQELDLFTSAEVVPVTSTTVDSLAVTSVGEDLMEPVVVQPPTSTGITGHSGSVSLLEKTDPSSQTEVKLEQDTLTCSVKADMEHTESKPLVRGMPVPPTSQPSVEKNLEFLKTPFFPESSAASSGSQGLFGPSAATSLIGPMSEIKSDDVNETPWIVTVTLYWNDIPAIVINNVPHVRLVDIHRQILPAKDTGILKKRCQLMNIPVSNCSEMQRYFLVQYGRAHNSKSTLVISKDEAQRLITYYAHPPPRNLRGEEGTGLRRSTSYAELRSIIDRPGNPGRHSAMAFSQPRKRGGFRRRPLPTRSHNPSPEPILPPVTPIIEPLLTMPLPVAPASPAKGLRHKKINFREMLKGEDSSSQLSPLTDGGMDEDSASVDETPVAKGRGSKAAATAGGKKRRGPKETGGGSPSKRGRKAWHKKNEGKEGSQEVPKKAVESEIVVDKDNSGTVVGTKTKKRSPVSAASGTLNASGRSPKSKYGPIKVNVKSLVSAAGSFSTDSSQPRKKNLFGRKSSSTDVIVDGSEEVAPRSNPLRVLRISHQDVEATSPPAPQILSPTAEVHLDLYKRASSACVKCRTCLKFLSVADFLKHQHVSKEEEVKNSTAHSDLCSSNQRRILVPMNKENISLEEQRLWNEFVALQESLDHSVGVTSMGAYPLTPLSPASPIGSPRDMFKELDSTALNGAHLMTMTPESPHPASLHNGHDDTGLDAESVPVMEGKCVVPTNGDLCSPSDPRVGDLSFSAEAAPYPWDSQLLCSSPSPLLTAHTQNEEKCLDNNLDSNDREIQSDPKTVVPCNKKQWAFQRPRRISPTTTIRTSSRKRETKRLYSFEKYEFGVGGKKGGRGETDTQDFEDDLPDSLLDDAGSVDMNNTTLHLAPVTSMHEPQNA